ncbi:MAG: cytochrome c [Gemmatimonadota bacterium]|nr:cytochrome c [Gemmatimonadota bacterium]
MSRSGRTRDRPAEGSPRTATRALRIGILVVACLGPPGAGAEAGSGEPSRAASAGEKTSAAIDAARADYALYCASCHGERGEGDGPLSAVLDPRPATLADPALAARRSDAYLYQIIEQGGAALGRSEQMAAWGETLSPEQLANLVAFIRQLAAAAPPRNVPN